MAAVRSGYRRLLRASHATFKGDTYALKQANITLKDEFLRNKHVTGGPEIGRKTSNMHTDSQNTAK